MRASLIEIDWPDFIVSSSIAWASRTSVMPILILAYELWLCGDLALGLYSLLLMRFPDLYFSTILFMWSFICLYYYSFFFSGDIYTDVCVLLIIGGDCYFSLSNSPSICWASYLWYSLWLLWPMCLSRLLSKVWAVLECIFLKSASVSTNDSTLENLE